jgi:hypothetical protein
MLPAITFTEGFGIIICFGVFVLVFSVLFGALTNVCWLGLNASEAPYRGR